MVIDQIPPKLRAFIDWADRQPDDITTGVLIQWKAEELERVDPRFGNRDYVSELALHMYTETLRSRESLPQSREQYRARLYQFLEESNHPVIALLTFYFLLSSHEDPTGATKETRRLIPTMQGLSVSESVSNYVDALTKESLEAMLTDTARVDKDLKQLGRTDLHNLEALDRLAKVIERKQPKLRDRRYVVRYATVFYLVHLIARNLPLDPDKDYTSRVWMLSLHFKRPIAVLRMVAECLKVDDPDEVLEYMADFTDRLYAQK